MNPEKKERNKKIYEYYLECKNFHKVARRFHLTPSRILRIVKRIELNNAEVHDNAKN